MNKLRLFLPLVILLFPAAALAQSTPGFVFGQTPTAGQWNAAFAAKQDALGYTPINKAGDTMLGKLTTVPSASGSSGFGLPGGAAPSSPVNGDVWTTSLGLYVRINGATIGPLIQKGGYTKAAATTGFSYVFANGQSRMLLEPSGTLATGTVTMAPVPVDKEEACLFSTQTITSLTVSAGAGQSINNAVSTLAANARVCYLYSSSNTTWDRSQ